MSKLTGVPRMRTRFQKVDRGVQWSAVVFLAIVLVAGCSTQSKLTKKEQERVDIYADLGLAYLKRNDLARAREPLMKALELDPQSPRAHHYAAEFYNRLEDPAMAEHHYREAVALTPDDPFLLNNFGAFLCGNKQIDEAEVYFLRVLKTPGYTKPEAVYENLGQCAMRMPDAEKAEHYFRSALKLKNDLPKSLYQMAQLHYDKRDFWRARAYFERYLNVGPQSAAALLLGIKIERELDAPEVVANYSDQLRAGYPESAEVQALIELEKEDQAKRKARRGKPIEVIVSEEVSPPVRKPDPATSDGPLPKPGEGRSAPVGGPSGAPNLERAGVAAPATEILAPDALNVESLELGADVDATIVDRPTPVGEPLP